jgi:hypothetical protein
MMLQMGYAAIAIAAWCTDSGFFLAIATFLFIILILRSVACCFVASQDRTYWIGSATLSCGLLLFSHHLIVFDGIAQYEDQRRHPMYSVPPSPATVTPYVPTSVNPPTAATQFYPTTEQSLAPPLVYISEPIAPTLSFRTSNVVYRSTNYNDDGFANVLKSFLISAVAYFVGAISGMICMNICDASRRSSQGAPES